MSYESYCAEYAVYGDPEREAMDYEENARYDQYDGYREDADLLAAQALFEDEIGCPDCDDSGVCPACLQAKADFDAWKAENDSDDCADEEVPF